MAERGWQDAEGLPEKGPAGPRRAALRTPRPDPPLSVRFRAVLSAVAEGPSDPELAILVQLAEHSLRVCKVFDAEGASVLTAPRMVCCVSCGAYAWGVSRNLPVAATGTRLARGSGSRGPGFARGSSPGGSLGIRVGASESLSALRLRTSWTSLG